MGGEEGDDYTTWMVNAPYIYDILMKEQLEWPTNSVQFFPELSKGESSDCVAQLLIATQTNGEEQNHILLFDVSLPEESEGTEAPPDRQKKFSVSRRIRHPDDIHRVLYNPADPNILATKSESGAVYVWNLKTQPSKPKAGETASPDATLKGLSQEGFGLAWSTQKKGHVASSGTDDIVCVWDIAGTGAATSSLKGHSGSVEDVAFHAQNADLLGTAGVDKTVRVWDMRTNECAYKIDAHTKDVNCLAFHPEEGKLVSGGSDAVVKLWDERKHAEPLHVFEGHENGVYRLHWAPWDSQILGSSGDDCVMIWNLGRIGEEQQDAEDDCDLPPELMFNHRGHRDKVSDFCFHQDENMSWLVASTDESNALQVWMMAEDIYNDEQGDEDAAPDGADVE